MSFIKEMIGREFKVLGLILNLWVLSNTVLAQHLDTTSWLTGTVVTVARDTIEGKIGVSRQFIQVLSGPSLRVLDPAQVRSYQLIDRQDGVLRRFARYETEGKLRNEFYEQIILGQIHFIRLYSEYYFYIYEPNYLKSGKSEDAWIPRQLRGSTADYFLWDGSQLHKIGPFKAIMKEISGRLWEQLASFAVENDLNYGKPDHQARLVNLYNLLYQANKVSNN